MTRAYVLGKNNVHCLQFFFSDHAEEMGKWLTKDKTRFCTLICAIGEKTKLLYCNQFYKHKRLLALLSRLIIRLTINYCISTARTILSSSFVFFLGEMSAHQQGFVKAFQALLELTGETPINAERQVLLDCCCCCMWGVVSVVVSLSLAWLDKWRSIERWLDWVF